MPNLDNNIYGLDETNDANAASSKALSAGRLSEWGGNPVDNSAKSVSSSDKSLKLDDASEQATVKITKIGTGSDSRARTAGNHGKQG